MGDYAGFYFMGHQKLALTASDGSYCARSCCQLQIIGQRRIGRRG
jgi:hypothetical protein